MKLNGKKIGLGITGSFCNFPKLPNIIKEIKSEGAEILPIFTSTAQTYDTRFNNSEEFIKNITELTGNKPILNIVEAEPIGPNNMIDIMLILPCTGNTIAKLAYAITDNAVLMATKSHLRNGKPVVIALSTNDALGMSAKKIGYLLASKNFYFVPFNQDAPDKKPNSLSFNSEKVVETLEKALDGIQIQPVID